MLASGDLNGWNNLWDVQGRNLHTFGGRGKCYFSPGSDALLMQRTNVQPWRLEILELSYPVRLREHQWRVSEAVKVLQANPSDPAAMRTLGEYYAFRSVDDRAIEFLEKARAAGAEVSPLLLARCYWKVGSLERAADEFRGAIARSEAPADYLNLCLAAVTPPPTATTRSSTTAAANH